MLGFLLTLTFQPAPWAYRFTTAKYWIDMHVECLPPFNGDKLVVNDRCLPPRAGVDGCVDHFVGAVASVAFTVRKVLDGEPPRNASIREVVTLLDQSPGMVAAEPYRMTVKLPASGMGSDSQVFGYDEGRVEAERRAAEREMAKSAWRRYRQELFMDDDRKPFAVLEWHHTTQQIRLVRVGPASLELVHK